MAIGWLTVLKTVPWGDVIGNAPKVADGAKKLWNAVAGKPTAELDEAPAPKPMVHPSTAPFDPAVAELQGQLAELQSGAAELRGQMLASTELIKALADQNTQLIQRVEVHRVRVMWLSGAVAVLAVAFVGTVAAVLLR